MPPWPAWRERLHEIIFRSDTRAGRLFDLGLLIAILGSVLAVMLESVAEVRARHEGELRAVEWGFTLLFTVEYALRLLCVRNPARYATSFFGLVDLLGILPTFLALVFPGAQALMTIRLLRMMRIFRILRLAQYVGESATLSRALRASRPKIVVFVVFVLSVVCSVGALMYVVEGPEHGFTSIPASIYWAIVTLTTVGYGDITPETSLGRVCASAVMILGYGVLAVPTGIVTTELALASRARRPERVCPSCAHEDHEADALHCKRCGEKL
jgi:voltage-gated potassium channel